MHRGALRVFKLGPGFISTFEEDAAKDPCHIREVSTGGDKDDNLFPSKLESPLHTGLPQRGKYGYRICWSKEGYEWCPYLPAVVTFKYPIFRGMSANPTIIYNGSGYALKEDEINMWRNVEYIMVKVAEAAGSGQHVSLEHKLPHPPSEYGYTQTHAQLKFAKKCAIKSLNAFQRLFSYCSYAIAGALSLDPLGDHGRFYSDRVISGIYGKLDQKEPDLHVLAKLLLSSLWEKRRDRNFAGVVVNHAETYDYVAMRNMLSHGVPVYVSWPGPGLDPYAAFRQHHYLDGFRPTPEHFKRLEKPPTPKQAAASTPIEAPAIRYGVPPAVRDPQTYDHPLDYIKLRLQKVEAEMKASTNRHVMQDRLKSALRLTNVGSAKYFRFEPTTVVDKVTGREKECWVRIQLTKADAMLEFQTVENKHLWFDCVSNQWSCSELLNIKGNLPCADLEPPSHEADEMDADGPFESGEELELGLALEEGELVSSPNDAVPVEATPPTFNGRFLLEPLRVPRFCVDRGLVDGWSNRDGFLSMRYGLRNGCDQMEDGTLENLPIALGLCKGTVEASAVRLLESTMGSAPLPSECDLSPGYEDDAGGFPLRSPKSVLSIRLFGQEGYVVTIKDRLWKLLIWDPLTVVQIEREGWHLQSDGLVLNLVRKGLPFKVLYPSCQIGTALYPHPGPVVHPEGKSPNIADYLAYLLDVADFFKLSPHAHAAALCAGGIVWRVAVDALPLLFEHEIVRPFHPQACFEYRVDGESYWTPKLTVEEEQVIVGVYMWADPKQSLRHDSWWPKVTAWDASGLDFGVWAPVNEAWYTRRKAGLVGRAVGAVAAKDWKGNVKFERPKTRRFLEGIRGYAHSFIVGSRL